LPCRRSRVRVPSSA